MEKKCTRIEMKRKENNQKTSTHTIAAAEELWCGDNEPVFMTRQDKRQKTTMFEHIFEYHVPFIDFVRECVNRPETR